MTKFRFMMSKATDRLKERGSALLVSLMVMVGLSLLGLGFVAISETENAIALNERNYVQTLAVAEVGAKAVLEWFQDPDWAYEHEMLPHNDHYDGLLDEILQERTVENTDGTEYIGSYKDGKPMLFDKPFKPAKVDRFWGSEEYPDVIIRADDYPGDVTSVADEFLEAFNNKLFPADFEGGRITEIAIYAPPIVDGELDPDTDCWNDKGTRYGLATIKVTSSKFNSADPPEPTATRTVKLVISEWPFPGPAGPIQSNANIATGGNFGVHWGKMTAQGTMEIGRPLVGMPWYDAYDKLHYEYGYDPGRFPLNAAIFADSENWLYEIVDRDIEDPWIEARARGDITNADAPGATPHPNKFDQKTDDILSTPIAGYSNWFQSQDYSNPPDYREVIFPKMDYNFWKEIAMQGRGQEGVYYLWPDAAGGEDFTDGITTKPFAEWVNTCTGNKGYRAKAGFYFFDTKNQLNPQGAGAPGTLSDPIDLNASDDGKPLLIQGFVYLNTEQYGTSGVEGPAAGDDDCIENGGTAPCYYGAPGEPFRDVGYKEVAADVFTGVVKGAGSGVWDYQDYNDNDEFDIVVASRSITRPSGGGAFNAVLPVPYTEGCTVGTDCSEPHEPFLNIMYPDTPRAGGGVEPMVIGWESTATLKPKAIDSSGVPYDCGTDPGKCTSNGYDRDGALFGDLTPMLNGVMYNEGAYESTGNAPYFGSLLINGDVGKAGTAEVWFDEALIKGDWPPKSMRIPRALITSHQTDQ